MLQAQGIKERLSSGELSIPEEEGHKKTYQNYYHIQTVYTHCTNGLSWLTWAPLTTIPVSGFANNTVFDPTILAITSGLNHLSNNLVEMFWVLELAVCKR